MGRASKIEFEVAGEHPETGDELMLNVRCTVAPGREAYTSGAPENCYPADPPEVDDVRVFRAPFEGPDPNYSIEVPEKDWTKYGIDLEMLEELATEKANEYWEGLQEREADRDDD